MESRSVTGAWYCGVQQLELQQWKADFRWVIPVISRVVVRIGRNLHGGELKDEGESTTCYYVFCTYFPLSYRPCDSFSTTEELLREVSDTVWVVFGSVEAETVRDAVIVGEPVTASADADDDPELVAVGGV